MGYFYTQKQLSEFRRMVAIANARLKRDNKTIGSYAGVACACGCGPFISLRKTNLTPPLPAKPKRPTIRSKKTHYMFSGKVVS